MSSQRRILLVDDSPIVRAIVVHALSAHNLSVDAVDDPRKIDAAFDLARPDLVLVDATFPDVTDDMLVEILTRHVPSVPVLLFSDRPSAQIEALVARAGAAGFVPKDGATLAERLQPFFRS